MMMMIPLLMVMMMKNDDVVDGDSIITSLTVLMPHQRKDGVGEDAVTIFNLLKNLQNGFYG